MAPLNDTRMFDFARSADQVNSSTKTLTPLPLHEQPPKNVSFAAVVTTRTVIHIKNYTSEEAASTWYSREELQNIKSEARVTANSSGMCQNNACIRGLEAKTLEGATVKRQNRMDARAAVYFEQEAQEEEGFSDPDAIADVYFEYSERCKAEAQMIGYRDEKAAMDAYQSLKLSDMEAPHGRIELAAPITGSAAA